MTQRKQTDNTFFDAKIKLRLDNLPKKKTAIKVLDCFCGDGLIWSAIRSRRPDLDIEILSIDKKPQTEQLHLIGNNLKFLKGIDLQAFDIIDLDPYGISYLQMNYVLTNKTKPGAVIFITAIQRTFGYLPMGFLTDLGYSKKMVHKAPTLFFRQGQKKIMDWLSTKKIKFVKMFCDEFKKVNYICFTKG